MKNTQCPIRRPFACAAALVVLGALLFFYWPASATGGGEENFSYKTLTVSARDYCESVGRPLSDYHMRGVNGPSFHTIVPLNADVVVDVRNTTGGTLYGTALILKKLPAEKVE